VSLAEIMFATVMLMAFPGFSTEVPSILH